MARTSKWISVEEMRPTQEWLREHGYRPDLVLVTQNDSHDASNWMPVPWDREQEEYWGWEGWLAIPEPPSVNAIDPDNPPSGGLVVTPPSPAERVGLIDKYMVELREWTDRIVERIDDLTEDRAVRKIEIRECVEEVLAERASNE